MEDVKDTLWRWAVQLSALAGLGYSTLSAITIIGQLVTHRGSSPNGLPFVLAAGFLLGPGLGLVWLQMVHLKRWAGWLIWALTSVVAVIDIFVVTSSIPAPRTVLHTVPPTAYSIALLYTLIFKPRLWRDGL